MKGLKPSLLHMGMNIIERCHRGIFFMSPCFWPLCLSIVHSQSAPSLIWTIDPDSYSSICVSPFLLMIRLWRNIYTAISLFLITATERQRIDDWPFTGDFTVVISHY